MTSPPQSPGPRRPADRPSRRARAWALRLGVAAVALVVLYLLAANLFLSTPLGSRVLNRRPEKVLVQWGSAWSVLPGVVHVRDFRLRIASPSVVWVLEVERGSGWIDLPGLLARRFTMSGFTGTGVRSDVERRRPPAGVRRRPGARRRQPWRLAFQGITFHEVRELAYGPFTLAGTGRMAGGYSMVLGGDVELDETTLDMGAGRLLMDGEEVADGLDVAAEIRIDPYAPREHRGVAGWDFISGSLTAAGVPRLDDLDRLAALPPGGAAAPPAGRLRADLRLERGRLAAGSRVELATPPRGPKGRGALEATLTVEPVRAASAGPSPPGPSPPAPLPSSRPDPRERGAETSREGGREPGEGGQGGEGHLQLFVAFHDLAIGRAGADRPPLVEIGELDGAAATPELRLSRIFRAARELRTSGMLPDEPLVGDLRFDRLRINGSGGRADWRLAVDRGTGRIDVPALLRRELVLREVRGEGGEAGLRLVAPPASRGTERPRWTIAIADAELADLRELSLDDLKLEGPGQLAGSLTYAPGVMAMPRLTYTMKGGRFLAGGGPPAGRGLDVRAEARIAPFAPGAASRTEVLRSLSGEVGIAGEVASFGFLERYFVKAPWLDLRGEGRLAADVRVEAGRLVPGTRLQAGPARVRTGFLDSVASGTATLTGTVQDGRPASTLLVGFSRFEIAPRAGGAPYVRGRGLTVNVSTDDRDLAEPIDDLNAVISATRASVPDITSYNAYLPPGSGLELLSGTGEVSLRLELDTRGAVQTGQGEVELSSRAVAARFQDLELAGGLRIRALLASTDLAARRFAVDGTRIDVDGVSWRDLGATAPAAGAGEVAAGTNGQAAVTAEGQAGEADAAPPWRGHLVLTDGVATWGRPLALASSIEAGMKDSGLLLAVFSQRRDLPGWIERVLEVEDVVARGHVELGDGAVVVDPLRASGGPLDLRSRLRLGQGAMRGDLLVRYGRLALGIELRDGKRDLKLLRPVQWYESREGDPPLPPR